MCPQKEMDPFGGGVDGKWMSVYFNICELSGANMPCFSFSVNSDDPLTSKWGEGGVNRPTWESICPIHMAVQNGDLVSQLFGDLDVE